MSPASLWRTWCTFEGAAGEKASEQVSRHLSSASVTQSRGADNSKQLASVQLESTEQSAKAIVNSIVLIVALELSFQNYFSRDRLVHFRTLLESCVCVAVFVLIQLCVMCLNKSFLR